MHPAGDPPATYLTYTGEFLECWPHAKNELKGCLTPRPASLSLNSDTHLGGPAFETLAAGLSMPSRHRCLVCWWGRRWTKNVVMISGRGPLHRPKTQADHKGCKGDVGTQAQPYALHYVRDGNGHPMQFAAQRLGSP